MLTNQKSQTELSLLYPTQKDDRLSEQFFDMGESRSRFKIPDKLHSSLDLLRPPSPLTAWRHENVGEKFCQERYIYLECKLSGRHCQSCECVCVKIECKTNGKKNKSERLRCLYRKVCGYEKNWKCLRALQEIIKQQSKFQLSKYLRNFLVKRNELNITSNNLFIYCYTVIDCCSLDPEEFLSDMLLIYLQLQINLFVYL